MSDLATKTDVDIMHDVARELAWDTRISPTEKETVLGAVRGTRGVRGVADHLRVEPYA